jgi:hypothetical protein
MHIVHTERWVENVARMGEKTGLYWDLVGRSDGQMQLERPGLISENNIKIEFQEMRWERGLD